MKQFKNYEQAKKNAEYAGGSKLPTGAYVCKIMDVKYQNGENGNSDMIKLQFDISEGEFKDFFKVLWKEFRVAVLCGISLGTAAIIKVMLVDHLIMKNDEVTFTVALVVGLTLLATILCAKAIGCSLPLLAKKVGLDPAVMASPFITTIVDAVSLLVYFRIASGLLTF